MINVKKPCSLTARAAAIKHLNGRAGSYLAKPPSLLTECDETRGVSVNVLKEFGHVDVRHTQRRAQQSRELLAGDSLVLVCVKQLQGREKERDWGLGGGSTFLDTIDTREHFPFWLEK